MFIEKAITAGVLEIMDSGAAIRNWGYINDAVELSLHILFQGREAIYNVGGRSRCSILELARVIAGLCGVRVVFPKVDRPVLGSPFSVELDLSRVEHEFDKHTYTPLEEGLAKTIAYQSLFYR